MIDHNRQDTVQSSEQRDYYTNVNQQPPKANKKAAAMSEFN